MTNKRTVVGKAWSNNTPPATEGTSLLLRSNSPSRCTTEAMAKERTLNCTVKCKNGWREERRGSSHASTQPNLEMLLSGKCLLAPTHAPNQRNKKRTNSPQLNFGSPWRSPEKEREREGQKPICERRRCRKPMAIPSSFRGQSLFTTSSALTAEDNLSGCKSRTNQYQTLALTPSPRACEDRVYTAAA